MQYIDQVKHAIIFECDSEWIQALHKTFYPYRDKVTIVEKYVSDVTGNGCIRLDDYIEGCREISGFQEKFLVKMDVEGAEGRALKGSIRLLQSKQARFTICTYHRPEDAQEFYHLFTDMGYRTHFSKNYLLVGGGEIFGEPSFRKGILQAWQE